MISVYILYEDGSLWFAGDFPDEIAAKAWGNEEMSRPYWNTKNQIIYK